MSKSPVVCWKYGHVLAAWCLLVTPIALSAEPDRSTRLIENPCPACAHALGWDAFRASIQGEITPVIVELRVPSAVRKRIAAEQAGREMPVEEMIAHGASLIAKQRSLVAALPGRGVRALLRENEARQIDGSVRHVQYQFWYLMNGFVAFVAREDLNRLRDQPEVLRVFELQPVRLMLDKAIDYSLGQQTNIPDRRLAVYGPTLEFQPASVTGHPEAPELHAQDGNEGQNMIIAVIDTGVDWRHPMFGGTGLTTPAPHVSGQPVTANDNQKVIYYYALSSPGDPTDDFGHGTLVTSCAAGYVVDGNTPANPGYGIGRDGTGIGPTPNGVQLHGMAPQARVMAYKVCGPANNCLGDIELAIEDAASPYTLAGSTTAGTVTNTFIPKPVADVINLSLGDTTGDPAGSTSVMANNAALTGTIVVSAAGNSGPGPGTVGAPGAATLVIAPAASLDPGSLAVGGLLASNQIPGETRDSSSAGPTPETGAASAANVPQAGTRQTINLFPAAGGGPIPQGSLSAHYVLVDRSNNTNTVPTDVQNRIALVKLAGGSTFFQNANAVAPFQPAAILLITATESATAVAVLGNIPTFTIGPDDANYLLDHMVTGAAGGGIPQGTISELPLRLSDSATLGAFVPDMASFSSRGPNSHPNARFRVVKPDVTAPGVGILGAATPDGIPSQTIGLADTSGYIQANGTSFACPITSGTMALLRQHVRDLGLDSTNLSAMHYRSTRFDAVTISRALLMNSASNLRSGYGVPQGEGTNSIASINDFGAGHINVSGALKAHAIMVAPTLLLAGLGEFIIPTNDPPVAPDLSMNGDLRVYIPSASFGAVPIVGVDGTIVLTQTVVLRDITGGPGGGTYNLSFQDNRNVDQGGFQIEFISVAGASISSVTVPPAGQASFGVRVTAVGNLISIDPTEFQWFVSAAHSVSGETLRMPFYLRAITPAIPNITAPAAQPIAADQPAAPGQCGTDTNSAYVVQWTYTPPAGGEAPLGFRVQEATRTSNVFLDDASEVLVANANSKWSGGMDWISQINPNNGRLAYYVPDTAQQNSSLTMLSSVAVPPGGATLTFLTAQDFEDGFDSGFAEISADGGISFSPVGSFLNNFTGTRIIDISQYAGKNIKLRFRMVSDLLNGPPDPAPTGWFIQDIAIASDDFHTIGSPGAATTSWAISGRTNGTYYYRIAGIFRTDFATAPGPYSDPACVTEAIGVPYIVSISVATNRHVTLNCLGTAGIPHQVQAGTNFLNWIVIGTRTPASDGTFQFEDASAIVPYKFYRLFRP